MSDLTRFWQQKEKKLDPKRGIENTHHLVFQQSANDNINLFHIYFFYYFFYIALYVNICNNLCPKSSLKTFKD